MKKLLLSLAAVATFTCHATTYKLVTNIDELEQGSKVIIANGTDGNIQVMSAPNTNNRNFTQVEATATNFKIVVPDKALILTLDISEGKYSFATAESSWLNAYSTSNYLHTTNVHQYASVEINETTYVATIKFETSNTSWKNWLRYNKASSLFSCYSTGQEDVYLYIEESDITPTETEAIELTQENFKVTAGGESVEFDEESDEAELNLWPNTEISFRYLTDNTKAELSYSYAVEAGEFVEGNSFTFTDEEDLMVQVRVTSGENSLEKNLYIYKRYPTECPKPVFNIADGAEVYAGKVITATAEGAEELDLYVNGEKVEGTSYIVAGEVGDEITLKAEASVCGKDDVLSAETEITVTVIAVPDGTFDFSTANAYGIKNSAGNSSTYDGGEKQFTSGIVTMDLSGTYRLVTVGSGYGLRLHASQNSNGIGKATFSVPSNYIITEIDFGTGSTNTINAAISSGNCSNNIWTPSELTNSVSFERTQDGNPTFVSATVKFALKPEVANFQHEGVKVTDKVATLDYTLAVKNHHELAKYVVTLSINDEDGKVVNTADFENHEFTYEFDFTENERPARVASQYLTATNTLVVDGLEAGTYYATVSYGLKGETPTEIALEEPVIVSSNTHETAVEAVVAGGAEAVWFDLNGRRVAEPSQKGIYLVRRGNSVEKAVVK